MHAITLLFDPEQEATVRGKILPRLTGDAVDAVAFTGRLPDAAGPETILLTCLSDAMLRPLVPEILSRQCRLALLPHPDMKHARIGYGIASRWGTRWMTSSPRRTPSRWICCTATASRCSTRW